MNPFFALALQRDARRHRAWLSLGGACALCFLVTWGGLSAWRAIEEYSRQNARTLQLPPVPDYAMPQALGGNIVGWFALAILGVLASFALWNAKTRSGNVLRSASLGGALGEWQLLPLREESWIAMLCAHPLMLALLCGLLGLPVYALAVFTGVWSGRDLLGIALVFLLIGAQVPSWNPRLWLGRGARFDQKRYLALMKEIRGNRDLSALSPPEKLELERAYARARVDASDPPGTTTTARTGAGGATKRRGQNENVGASLARIIGGVIFITTVMPTLLLSLLNPRLWRGASGTAFDAYFDALPPGTLALLPSLPLSWPLLCARVLVSPLPYFGWHLAPIWLLLPLYVASKGARLQVLAAGVSASETFWTPRRARARACFAAWSSALSLALFGGYSWPLLVDAGWGAKLLLGAPLTPSAALASAWTLLLLMSAFGSARGSVSEPLRRMRLGRSSPAHAWRASLWALIKRFGIALFIFAGFCVLGGVRDLGVEWRERAWPVFATCGAFALMLWSFELLSSARPELRARLTAARFAWLLLPAIGVSVWIVWLTAHHLDPTWRDGAPTLYSPLFASLALFRFDLSQPAPLHWARYAIVNAALSCALILLAARWTWARAQAATPSDNGAPEWWKKLVAVWNACKARLKWLILWLPLAIGRYYEAANAWILRPFEASDNPILRDEMRRRVRREAWLMQWLAAVIGGALAVWMFADPWNAFTGGYGAAWLGNWGVGVFFTVAGFACLGALAGPVKLGVCLDRERANGQLAFLFLTPLSEREILLGKWLPELIHSAGLFASVLLPLGLATFALLLSGAFWVLPAFFAALLCMSAALLWSTLAQLAAATRARKSGEGASWGALAIFSLELGAALFIGFLLWAFGDFGTGHTVAVAVFIGALLFALHLFAALAAWKLALRWFGGHRFVSGGDKGAS